MVEDVSTGGLVARIAHRLAEVRRRIVEASNAAGRDPSAVRLVAASKGQPVEAIRAAWDHGQHDFGENYVQELTNKAAQLRELEGPGGLRWHAIGRLQRNKVRDVLRIASVIHAVDRAELAREINRRVAAEGRHAEVLVEVNLGAETSKGGCAPKDLGPLLEDIADCVHLTVRGLMTIPPATDTSEEARRFFSALRELRDRHGGAPVLPELSMGMSHDFEVAIAEGATLVRVGTAIFGAREPAPDREPRP